MKHIKSIFDDISDDNLMPNSTIKIFYNRLKDRLEESKDKNHPSIIRELDRIKMVNGNKIPSIIQELLDKFQ